MCLGTHISQGNTYHCSTGSGKSRKMVRDQYQVMGLVIPPKLTLTDLMYTPTVMFIAVVWEQPVMASLNFWSRAIFWNFALPEKCTDPERKCMRTRSVCGFFLTWVGSYENHCFGINAHTFLFQVGHPSICGAVGG